MDKKERFILKNKAAFKKRYGADWERVLYSTANKMFKEEHGAGDWGTDKLTSKYLKDTPGQEDAIVKSKKVVLKKKAVEEEQPSEPKNKPMPDNKGYAERRAAAKKAKQDKMDRMVRARLAGGPPRKNRGAFWKREKSVGESVEVVESDKAEYNKLMDKYGDMPMSKVPMKARLRIRELGRSVRGDKGGPTAGDLVKSMKRRRMGEEVEQVGEAVDGWIAMYNGKKVEIKKSEAKDLYAAKLKAIQMLKVPKSKQGLLAIKPAVNEEVEQVGEVKYGGLLHKVRKGGKPGGLRDKIDQGYSLRSPETFFDPKEMSKSDVGRAQRMVDRRPSLKGKGPIDDPDNYALKSGGVDMAGIYYDKGDKSGSAKLARQLRKERSRKRSRRQRNEEVEVAEGGMIGRTKPSRELNVQKDEKPHLAGVKSLKYQKRAAHKAERKKGKQDVKINPELDETVERAKRGVDMAKQRVLAAKQRVARAKARDLGQKRREMRNEDSEIEEGGMSGRDFAQAGRSADYKSRVSGTQQRYAANRAKRSARATEKHSDVLRRRAIARARSRMRK